MTLVNGAPLMFCHLQATNMFQSMERIGIFYPEDNYSTGNTVQNSSSFCNMAYGDAFVTNCDETGTESDHQRKDSKTNSCLKRGANKEVPIKWDFDAEMFENEERHYKEISAFREDENARKSRLAMPRYSNKILKRSLSKAKHEANKLAKELKTRFRKQGTACLSRGGRNFLVDSGAS